MLGFAQAMSTHSTAGYVGDIPRPASDPAPNNNKEVPTLFLPYIGDMRVESLGDAYFR